MSESLDVVDIAIDSGIVAMLNTLVIHEREYVRVERRIW